MSFFLPTPVYLKFYIRADDDLSLTENSDSPTLLRRGNVTALALLAYRDLIIRLYLLV